MLGIEGLVFKLMGYNFKRQNVRILCWGLEKVDLGVSSLLNICYAFGWYQNVSNHQEFFLKLLVKENKVGKLSVCNETSI